MIFTLSMLLGLIASSSLAAEKAQPKRKLANMNLYCYSISSSGVMTQFITLNKESSDIYTHGADVTNPAEVKQLSKETLKFKATDKGTVFTAKTKGNVEGPGQVVIRLGEQQPSSEGFKASITYSAPGLIPSSDEAICSFQ